VLKGKGRFFKHLRKAHHCELFSDLSQTDAGFVPAMPNVKDDEPVAKTQNLARKIQRRTNCKRTNKVRS
jgi:hypothetical protein